MTTSTREKRMPKLGEGCTICFASDCAPATVVEISPSGKTVTVQRDHGIVTKRAKSYGDEPEYRFEQDLEGPKTVFRLNKHGAYCAKGGHPRLFLGERRKYTDPHF